MPSSSMESMRESTLKVSRSSSVKSPANAPKDPHQWVIFDVDDMVLENASILTMSEVSCPGLRETTYLPGTGFCALAICKRGEGAARAGRA